MLNFTYDVFLSHATEDDTYLIDRIAWALTHAGLRVYVDHQQLQPGAEWDEAIQNALRQSRVGLLALSPHSLASSQCNGEWRYILNQKRKLYIARITPVALSQFHSRLCIIQYADLVDDFNQGIAVLVQALNSVHGHLDVTSPAVRVALPSSGSFPHDQLALPIFGRDEDLTAIKSSLLAHRPVILTGIGGIGKTKLAAVLAATGAYLDGAIWYRIPSATTPELAQSGLDGLTALLREHLQLPPSTIEAQVWKLIEPLHLLLILDNAEHCLYPAPYVLRLQALRQENIAVLITSRHRWPELKSRAYEHCLDVPAPTAAEAICATMVRSMGGIDELTLDETRDLVAAAHYHPRMIEFASSWIKDYEPTWVIEKLRELRGNNIEEALYEVVGHTLELVRLQLSGSQILSDLARLVIYRNGFRIQAAETMLPDTHEVTINRLRSWHLLRLSAHRYSVDPLVIAFIKPDNTALAAHYKYYKSLAKELTKQQQFSLLAEEIPNLEVAFEWALETQEVGKAYELANAAAELLYNQGLFAKELRWLQSVKKVLDNKDLSLRSALANSLGMSYAAQPLGNRLNNLKQAISNYQIALEYRSETTYSYEFAATQNNLGNAYRYLSQVREREANLNQAVEAYQKALVYRTKANNPIDFATTQNNLGNAYRDLALIRERATNLSRAINAYEIAAPVYYAYNVLLDFAMVKNNIGNTYADLAYVQDRLINLNRASQAYQVALVYRTKITAPYAFARTQNNLGTVYRDLAQIQDPEANLIHAIEAYQIALEFRTKESNPLDYAVTQNNLGTAYRDLSQIQDKENNLCKAIKAYQKALIYRTEDISPLDFVSTQNNLGTAYCYLAQIRDRKYNINLALRAYRAAVRVAKIHDSSYHRARAMANLAILFKANGKTSASEQYMQEAECHYQRIDDYTGAERMRNIMNTI